MIFQATHVYSIYCSYIPKPRYKYSICICPVRARFFWINTEPRKTKPNAQILITPKELSRLKHDSYINTGEIFTFPPHDLKTAEHIAALKQSTKKNIKAAVYESQYLTGNQIEMVIKIF